MKQTSEICANFIPAELIEHLWNIVEIYDEDKYVFVLSSRRLGDGIVQDINIIIGSTSSHHTIYGYKPVNFKIKVSKTDDDYTMSLIPSEKTAHEINKWTQRKFNFHFLKKIALAPAPHQFRVRNAC